MKRLSNLFVCICMMMASILSFNNTSAAVISKRILNAYDGSFNITNSSYDITGNQKKDQIQMSGSYDGYAYDSFSIKINGSTVLSKYYSWDDIAPLAIKVYYFKLKNGKEYLTVHATEEDACVVFSNLYAYKNGKLTVVKNFKSVFSWLKGWTSAESIKASGNNIVINYFCDSDMIGHADFKATFKYSSFAEPSSVTFSRFYNSNGGKYLISKTTTQFPVYKTAGKTKKAATIKKGTKFYPLGFKKVNGKLYYYVKVGSKKGYMLHKDSYGNYFKYESHSG